MGINWLANAHPETFWPHHAWPEFAALPKNTKARMTVVLPVHGFADHGLGLPLDAEEAVGGAVLRRAAEIAGAAGAALRVLPPLRFGLAPYLSTHFGVDAETARGQMLEIVKSVRAAGFGKIVFFNTSPWNEELAATVALDTRVEFGLRNHVVNLCNHVVNLSAPGMSFHPGAPREARANAQAAAAHALGLTAREVRDNVKKSAKSDVRDADFRPGNFRRPEPLAPDAALDGAAILEAAAARLAASVCASARGLPADGVSNLKTASGLRAQSKGARTFLSVMEFPQPADTDKNVRAPLSPNAVFRLNRARAAGAPAPAPVFPLSCRSCYLPALTAAELAALQDKRRALVIIPAGAIEQHGPHLPVGVDAILGQAWLARALPKLSKNAAKRVFVAPPITFGKSNEHEGFAGTIAISAGTLRRVLLALAAELRALGFRNIAVLNTHGGNSAVIVHTLREIQAMPGMRAGMLKPPLSPELSAKEAALGIHAGQWETALMLACAPELVRMDKAVCEYPARPLDGVAWMTRDVSKSGVMGDAPAATPAQGASWLEKSSRALAARIEELLK